MTVTIYGIKNCDTMKKAFKWLSEHNIDHEFHDYKKQGISAELAERWLSNIPLEELINKRGTTWRKLDDAIKNSLTRENAAQLIIENTSLVKRPLLEANGKFHLGFKPESYAELLS